jgi:hypothetical protein
MSSCSAAAVTQLHVPTIRSVSTPPSLSTQKTCTKAQSTNVTARLCIRRFVPVAQAMRNSYRVMCARSVLSETKAMNAMASRQRARTITTTLFAMCNVHADLGPNRFWNQTWRFDLSSSCARIQLSATASWKKQRQSARHRKPQFHTVVALLYKQCPSVRFCMHISMATVTRTEYAECEKRAIQAETKRLMLLRLQGVNLVPCSNCTLIKPLFELQACSRCHGVAYCKKACQVAAWPHHKRFCKKAERDQLATGTRGAFAHGAEHPPLSLPCKNCKRSTDLVEMVMCSSCHSAGYCSRRCRHEDWRDGHRNECNLADESIVKLYPKDEQEPATPSTSARVIPPGADDFIVV